MKLIHMAIIIENISALHETNIMGKFVLVVIESNVLFFGVNL